MPLFTKSAKFSINKPCLILLFATILIDCNASDKQTANPEVITRTDTIETELMVEGMPESMQMYLLQSPEGFPLHFSTYIPVEMQIDTAHYETGEAIHVIAAFGGRVNRDARFTIFAFSSEVSEKKARSLAREKAGSPGSTPADSTQFAWAETVYDLNENRGGFLVLAQKENTWFYLLATYPPVYADGMGPRIAMILDEWRWTDNGKPLR